MIYLDSSVVCSLHVRDVNSHAALSLVQTAPDRLLISPLVEVEVINAFNLRVFRREWMRMNMENAVRDLESDIGSGLLLLNSFPDAAFAQAKRLTRNLTAAIGLRTADLLHVAIAIELGATTLYTFDRKQNRAARAAGLLANQMP